MADKSEQVTVRGLKELNKSLKAAGETGLAKGMQKVQKQIATDIVEKAQSKAGSLPGLGSRSFQEGLKASATQTSAKVTMDSSVAPTIFGDEFGARKYPQFQVWLGNQWNDGDGPEPGVGYALYPTIRGESDHSQREYESMVQDIIDRL